MSLQDPVADMLVRIKNAQAVMKKEVVFPSSKLKSAILEVLQSEGYIRGFETSGSMKPETKVALKYYEGKPVIDSLKRVSRHGLRIYKSAADLPIVKGGLGIAVI